MFLKKDINFCFICLKYLFFWISIFLLTIKNIGAVNWYYSVWKTTLSIPLPLSSQIPILRIKLAKFSLRDIGRLSRNRITSRSGLPRFMISIRLLNISIVELVPCVEKSWCINAFATNSLIAISGYIGTLDVLVLIIYWQINNAMCIFCMITLWYLYLECKK